MYHEILSRLSYAGNQLSTISTIHDTVINQPLYCQIPFITFNSNNDIYVFFLLSAYTLTSYTICLVCDLIHSPRNNIFSVSKLRILDSQALLYSPLSQTVLNPVKRYSTLSETVLKPQSQHRSNRATAVKLLKITKTVHMEGCNKVLYWKPPTQNWVKWFSPNDPRIYREWMLKGCQAILPFYICMLDECHKGPHSHAIMALDWLSFQR